jgi:hypothetical protein
MLILVPLLHHRQLFLLVLLIISLLLMFLGTTSLTYLPETKKLGHREKNEEEGRSHQNEILPLPRQRPQPSVLGFRPRIDDRRRRSAHRCSVLVRLVTQDVPKLSDMIFSMCFSLGAIASITDFSHEF